MLILKSLTISSVASADKYRYIRDYWKNQIKKVMFAFLSVCVCVCDTHIYPKEYVHAMGRKWRSEYNFLELVLSFYHVDFGDQTQIVRLGRKYLYRPCHFSGPITTTLENNLTVS